MALASGHWIEKEIKGALPCPRHGHALAVAGNIAFLFGGMSTLNSLDGQPKHLNDFYMFTVSPTDLTWEVIPQNGLIPPAREGHSLCVINGKLYLFGGASHPQAKECLPGVYCFNTASLTWEKLKTGGVSLKSLKHSAVTVGDNIYVFGGILDGTPKDDLLMFSTVSMTWTPVKTTGSLPSARYGHTCALVGDQIYMFGGCSGDNCYHTDVHILNTDTLIWQKLEVKGESPVGCAGHTFTPHHDKDIYLFGGRYISKNGTITSTNEIHKLSIAKMKWKVPLYIGIPPTGRHSHTAFILHGHMYVFGGSNEEKEFNDLNVMKLINPSERQPKCILKKIFEQLMKEILSEFGIQGLSNSFAPTKVPNVKYELSEPPFPTRIESPPPVQLASSGDFSAVRNKAMETINRAFAMLDNEFLKLDNEKSLIAQAAIALQHEREVYSIQYQKQQQEFQEMLEKHKAQNEAWLKARAEENDKERKELYKLREEILQEQKKLKEEQENIQKRSEQLLSIMQQFKGMVIGEPIPASNGSTALKEFGLEEILQEQKKLKEEQENIQKRSEQLLSIMQQFKGM